MIPYGRQSISKQDIKEVVKVLKSNWLTQGPKITEFENKLAAYVGAKYAVAVCNGTAALHLAYLAAGLKKRDEVITTANTFVATSNMLLAVGAKPVFCDIKTDTCNIDESKIEALITSRTRAIVPVHFGGHPCEMKKIWQLAKKYNLKVIEDASHALGAKYGKEFIGGGKSDLVTFSFHPVKPITTAEGGMIVTNSPQYYAKLRLLRTHGIQKDANGFNVMTDLGYNYRITDIQTALGVSQLKRLKKFLQLRHQVVKWYEKELSKIKQIILPVELKGIYSGWHLYVVRVKNPKDHLPLYRHLQQNGIGVNLHYPAVHTQPYYRKNGYKDLKLKNAEKYQETAITLPCYSQLTRRQVNAICSVIKFYFKHAI